MVSFCSNIYLQLFTIIPSHILWYFVIIYVIDMMNASLYYNLM